MIANTKNNTLALSIMVAITLLNIALAVNFLSANGRAMAAAFTSHTIFMLAGIELIAVLVTYVVSTHRPVIPSRTGANAMYRQR
jgi:hypothetical protein